jgi:hypothetical protein
MLVVRGGIFLSILCAMKSTQFKAGAVCAFLSAITTIGIHSIFRSPGSFEESLLIYKTGMYVFSKWWVIFHCLFVIISIYAFVYYLDARGVSFANLGFSFYFAFGIIEILRMFLVLHYLRQLRDQYLSADSEVLRDTIRLSIDNIQGIGNMLFSAFTVAIIAGNLFVGLACLSQEKYIRYFGIALIVWACVLVISLTNEYSNIAWIGSFVGMFSLIFQPIIRCALGVLLMRFSKEGKAV